MDSDSESDFSDSESISDLSFASDWSIDNYFEISADDKDEEDGPNEIYDPEGVESDDDQAGCCHWSTNNDEGLQDSILPLDGIPEYGKPAVNFDIGTKPHEIIESIMDDGWLCHYVH